MQRLWPRSDQQGNLVAPSRALSLLLEELDDLDEHDRERVLLARRAMSLREPTLLRSNAVGNVRLAAEADIRRIWTKRHPDSPMETL
jgi:hypothetical protein